MFLSLVNIFKESPSQDFQEPLESLSYDIDKYYDKSLKNFDGEIGQFQGIKDLIETHLHTSLIYPLKIVNSKEVKLDSDEKSLVNKALNIMKENSVDRFYISYLMGKAKEFNVKNAEIILKLIEIEFF